MTVSVSVLSQSVVFYDTNGSPRILIENYYAMYVRYFGSSCHGVPGLSGSGCMGDLLSIVEVKSNRELDC